MNTLLWITHPLNGVLMIALPVGLGIILARRFSIDWRFWGIGAATFILSQVGHLPFNAGLNALFRNGSLPIPPPEWQLPFNAIVGGLSAGIWEECSRYATYRWWAKKARTWRRSLMLGAGHGGIESILLGALVLWTFLRLVALRDANLSTLFPSSQLELAQQQVDQYWSLPWQYPLLGALERVFAIVTHLALSVLVWQVFESNHLRWLGAAIGWHTIFNAAAVYAASAWGAFWAMLVMAVAALAGIGMIFALRLPEPQLPVDPAKPVSIFSTLEITPIEETPEKLEQTRYD